MLLFRGDRDDHVVQYQLWSVCLHFLDDEEGICSVRLVQTKRQTNVLKNSAVLNKVLHLPTIFALLFFFFFDEDAVPGFFNIEEIEVMDGVSVKGLFLSSTLLRLFSFAVGFANF
jgi:hypothetical protein